jgi:signal peptidase I
MTKKKRYRHKKPNSRRNKKLKKFGRKIHFSIKNWKPNMKLLKELASWVFKIAIVCLLAFVAVLYFGQRISNVGESMSPVLENGDVVLVNRIVYSASSPKRGDVIVFKPKGNENSHYYVKRIVGLPGETIEIIENRVYINGVKLEEDYETTNIDNVGIAGEAFTLGSDEYFVLGDNRENSEDSRNADVGAVKRDYIYGKAWYILSPGKHRGVIR